MNKDRFETLLLIVLLAQVYSQDAESTANCQANSTIPKLQDLMEASVEKVLRGFGFDNQNQTENCQCPESERTPRTLESAQECPIGWMKMIDTCIWISPQDEADRLSYHEATMHCKGMTPGGRLFEPRNQTLDETIHDYIRVHDGKLVKVGIWIGVNDQVEEGKFVYESTEEPIVFANWRSGDPDGGRNQNCVIYYYQLSLTTWIDDNCTDKWRYICEKSLN